MTLNDLVTALEDVVKKIPRSELSESIVQRIRLCAHNAEWRLWLCRDYNPNSTIGNLPKLIEESGSSIEVIGIIPVRKEVETCTTTSAEKCCR